MMEMDTTYSPSNVQHQQEDFAKKKQEREQEIHEIQEMLNNIAKSPQKSKIGTTDSSPIDLEQKTDDITPKVPTVNTLRRSNTDLQVQLKSKATPNSASPRMSRIDSARSVTKARSKSAQVPTSTTPSKRQVSKKTYNPEEARRFMENQKKKRKSEAANQPEVKATMEKEEIKRRLEELKRNTRKLVSKNLDKKNQHSNRNEMSKEPEETSSKPKKSKESSKMPEKGKVYVESVQRGGDMHLLKGISLQLQKPLGFQTDRVRDVKHLKEDQLRSAHNVGPIQAKPSLLPLGENHKRIGLLRKTEDEKDYSFSALKSITSGKENVGLEGFSSKLNTPATEEKTNIKERVDKTEKQKDLPTMPEGEAPPKCLDKTEINKQSVSEEEISDLEIPRKNLQSNNFKAKSSGHHGNANVPQQEDLKSSDLPYWLRPSAAQVYPYNFIMAVRRKLEAISQPNTPVPNKQERTLKTSQCTSTTDLLKGNATTSAALDTLECEKKRKLLERPDEQESKKRKSIETVATEMEDVNCESLQSLADYSQGKKPTQESKKSPKGDVFTMSLESLKSPQTYTMDIQKEFATKDTSAAENNVKLLGNRKTLQNLKESSSSLDFEEYPQRNIQSKFKSMESVASNYSSVSLPMAISNTLTEVSSLRTESRRTYTPSVGKQSHLNTEDEVASISSHIFSSPEKKYDKPSHQDFEFVKPRPVSPLSLDKIEKLKIKSKQTKSDRKDMQQTPDTSHLVDEDREMHFSQLLEDFNRSLSQVIQVNEQLKTTLDKSHRILSPRNPKRSPSTETDKQNYSSDFENSPQQHSLENNKLKLSLENTNAKLKQRKRQLFEIANKVKPLLATPQKTSTESEGYEDLKETPLPKLDLDINLKLINNSSARTNTSTNTYEAEESDGGEDENNSEIEVEASEEYEKRLNMIEQLKANLKQSILESQEKRKENEIYKASRNIAKGNLIHSEEEFSNKSNRSNMSVYAMQQEDGIEKLKKIKPKTELREAGVMKMLNENVNKQPEHHIQTQPEEENINYNDCKDKEDLIQKYTYSLKEQNSNETLVLYKRNKMMTANENAAAESGDKQNNFARQKYTNMSNRPSNQQDYYDSGSSQSPVKGHYKISKTHQTSLKTKDYTDGYSNTTSQAQSASTQRTLSSESSPQKSVHTRSQATKEMQSEVASSEPQSEVESLLVVTTHNSDNAKGPGPRPTKAKSPKEGDNSSSIAEELQNTFETASQDNENQPPHQTKLNSSGNRSKLSTTSSKHDHTAFIKSHINLSRGDFRETLSKEATLNETQFHLAIRSSQASSSEFAQSADDEVTSSVRSIIKGQPATAYSNPPSYNAVTGKKSCSLTTLSPSKPSRRISIGSEIVNFFHKYENERTLRNNDTMSESSLNYSNVGLYDKLIQNELSKSQHLTALLKMREKALLDRTKGQIAWLEVQKARYKAKGLVGNIAVIKKKQRGILLKMEKEREEIKRLLQSTSTSSNAKTPAGAAAATATPASTIGHHYTSTKYRKERQPSTAPPALAPSATRPTRPAKQQTNAFTKADQQPQSAPILRATYELESSQALEELLKKREEDLRKRRQHVEHLMKWHQRLDVEEAEVLQLERQLLNYNNVPQHLLVEQQQQPQSQQQQPQMPQLHSVIADEEELTTPGADINDDDTTNQSTATKTPEKKRASRARKMEKRLKDIDKSLKELSHISASSAANSAIVMGQNSDDIDVSSASTQGVDFVRTTGSKLNKLWRRLTSQTVEKYEPNRRYKLCKADLERLYEEAKMAVLRDFTQDEERTAQELLEKSATTNLSSTASPVPQPPPFINAVHLPEGGGTATEAEANGSNVNMVDIPVLNLNFSSGPSEPEEESANNSKMVAAPQGNYSPSVAEENFKAHLLNSSASSSSDSSEQQQDHVSDWELQQQQQQQQQRIENNVQMFIALTQRLKLGSALTLPNNKQPNQGLQRSLSDTQIAEMPKFSAATSHRNISANASQYTNTSITSNGSPSAPQQTTLPIHHRSKSSIAEISNIPNEKETEKPSPPPPTKHIPQKSLEELEPDCSAVASTFLTGTRASVITAVGRVSPIAHTTPSTTRDEEAASSTTQMFPDTAKDSAAAFQPKLSYSGQVGGDSELKAREISSKLDEISAAVIQLSQANALPSYPAATATATISKPASTDSAAEEQPSLNEESNLSTDASSYSLHFANISIDRHSSPGSQHANTTKAATTTFTKAEHNASESLENSQIATFLVSPHNATTSKTFVKDSTATSQTFVKECAESELSNIAVSLSTADKPSSSEEYEPDFEPDSNDETHIEDISLPLYETTTDTTNEGEVDLNETAKGADEPLSDKTFCAEPMQMKDPGCQEQQQLVTARPTITINTSPENELLPPPPLPPPPPPPPANATTSTSTSSNGSNNNQLMPDILNELELRRHQLVLDNEHLKQYEHVTAVPYMYVREIPNKPPPPYVPPAHGSPMTTIFPSEERIKDITFRRTHELYCELLKTEYCNEKGEKLPSVTEEQITNIYERIILDICREYLEEHNEIVRDGDPTNFHSQLAFFNPPDRLRCIQKAIYKEVRLCLAMDKTQPKRTQVYSVYGQRAKQDHIGKIIIQEMYDEDDRWCNFHREESEVLHLIVEEMIGKNIRDMAKEVLVEEGGSLEEDEEDDGIEIEEIEDTEIQENLENTREEEGCLTTQTLKTSVLTEHTNKKDQTQYINNSLDDSSLSDRSPQEEFAKIKGSIIMTSST